MLQSIRENVSGWVAGVIISLLTIPFALWGINNYFVSSVEDYVAKVNDYEISTSEFQERLRQYQQRMQAMFGDSLDASYFQQPLIKRQLLDSLIQERLLIDEATSQGFAVDSKTLAETIAGFEAFQIDGQFNPEVYRSLLKQRLMSPQQFEQDIAEQILMSQVPQLLTSTAVLGEAELNVLASLRFQKRSWNYLLLDEMAIADKPEVSDEEIKSYYEENSERYMTEEKIRIAYIEINEEDFLDDVEVDEAVISERYEAQKQRFITPARRKVSHILIELAEDASDEEMQAADKRMQEVIGKLESGSSFSELAREYSEDPGSSESGGDLGWVDKGMMVPEFEQAMLALNEVGQVSEVVRSPFGLHLIRLNAYEPETGLELSEARPELEAEYRKEQAERRYLDAADKAVDLSYEFSENLKITAEELGLQVQESDWFTRTNGDGIAALDNIRDTAWSDAIMYEAVNSDPVEIGKNHTVILRLLDRQDPELKPLEAVRETISVSIYSEKLGNMLTDLYGKMKQTVQEGKTMSELATEFDLGLMEEKEIARTGSDAANPQLKQHVFATAVNQDAPKCVELSTQSYACFRLTAVNNGSLSALSDEEKEQLANELKRRSGNAELNALLASLKSKAEIKIQEDRL